MLTKCHFGTWSSCNGERNYVSFGQLKPYMRKCYGESSISFLRLRQYLSCMPKTLPFLTCPKTVSLCPGTAQRPVSGRVPLQSERADWMRERKALCLDGHVLLGLSSSARMQEGGSP